MCSAARFGLPASGGGSTVNPASTPPPRPIILLYDSSSKQHTIARVWQHCRTSQRGTCLLGNSGVVRVESQARFGEPRGLRTYRTVVLQRHHCDRPHPHLPYPRPGPSAANEAPPLALRTSRLQVQVLCSPPAPWDYWRPRPDGFRSHGRPSPGCCPPGNGGTPPTLPWRERRSGGTLAGGGLRGLGRREVACPYLSALQ